MTVGAPGPPRRLSLPSKVLFGVGSTEDGAQILLLGGLLLLYYVQVLGLPAGGVSAVLGAALVVDAVFDLVVAQWSDNLRTRLGRRHPLMYLSVLPVGVSFVALWSPPPNLTQPQLFVWLAVSVTLFRLSHSLYMVPSGALLPELAPGYDERTQLFGFRYMLGAIGGAAAAVLAYGVFLRGTPEHPQGQLRAAGYPAMALAVAALIMAANLASGIGTHACIPSLHRPERARFSMGRWFGQIADIFRNANFLIAIAGSALASAATALTQGLAIYFNTFVFGLPAKSVMWLVGAQALSAPPGFLLASWASRRWGKRGAYLSLFAASLVFVYGPLALRLLDLLPPNGAPLLLPLLLAAQVTSGVLIIASMIVNTSMVADVIEENQARTGRRSEGLVLFSDRLLLKMASGLATILPGLLLAWVRFPGGAQAAPAPAVLRHLVLAYLAFGLLLSAAVFPIWLRFRIDRESHARNLAAIAASGGPAA